MHGISGYIIVVIFKLTIDSGNASDADEVSVVNSAERYTFHDLSPHTDYHITIWAVNKAGSGPVSTVNVTTLSVIDVPTDTRMYSTCVHVMHAHLYKPYIPHIHVCAVSS